MTSQPPPAGALPLPPATPNSERDAVQSALNYLDPSCDYETWFRIVLGVGDAGYPELADEWSAKSPKHVPGQDTYARKVGQGYRHPHPVTLGTLFHMARENGWNPPVAQRLTFTLDPDAPVWEDHDNIETPNIRFYGPRNLKDVPDPLWVVPGLFARGVPHILAGASGSGKSTMLASIAVHGQFLEDPCTVDRIWHLVEDGRIPVRATYRRAGLDLDQDPHRVVFGEMGEGYSWDGLMEDLYRFYHQASVKPDILVLDTLHHWGLAGIDANSSTDIRKALKPVAQLADYLDCATVVTHHTRKNVRGGLDDIEGAMQFRAAMTQRALLKQYDDGSSYIESQGKLMDATRHFNFLMTLSPEGAKFVTTAAPRVTAAGRRDAIIELATEHEVITQKMVQDELELERSSAGEYLRKLVAQGKLVETHGARNRKEYRLPQ